jgi:preprotein translocase subunit SecE
MKWINKFIAYIKEARIELKKVIWPSRDEVTKHTLIVIGVSLGVALFLGIFDYAFFIILEKIV